MQKNTFRLINQLLHCYFKRLCILIESDTWCCIYIGFRMVPNIRLDCNVTAWNDVKPTILHTCMRVFIHLWFSFCVKFKRQWKRPRSKCAFTVNSISNRDIDKSNELVEYDIFDYIYKLVECGKSKKQQRNNWMTLQNPRRFLFSFSTCCEYWFDCNSRASSK